MALFNCVDCNTEISTAAINCPKCGRPTNSPSSQAPVKQAEQNGKSIGIVGKIGAAVLIGLVIIISLASLGIKNKNDQAEAAALATAQAVAAQEAAAAAAEAERIRNMPEIPIQVAYREALMGSGLVGQFKNSSDKHLAVLITLNNPTMNSTKTGRLDIAPHETKEIGHMEGWPFSSGDKIEISHDGYKTLLVQIP